jgi:amino acid adenylation domain-containing protein
VINPARSLARHPLCQVMLSLQSTSPALLELAGLTTAFAPVGSASAKFDLSLSLAEQRMPDGRPAGMAGTLEYATDLFDRATVEAMSQRLIRLLEAAVADAERPIGSLDLLAPEERRTILHHWNNTAREVPFATLPELFAAQAARTPAATAIVLEDISLTYGELIGAPISWRIICALGVGPEVVVGLCAERSLEMLVGLVGILKAGGAYLPLDPDYPPERLAFMLADAQAPVLVAQSTLIERLPRHDARIVRLDTEWPRIATRPTTAPATSLDPRNTAYVIYTSGSTGTPKGVAVQHQSLVNLCYAQRPDFPMQPGDRVLAIASISFDTSIEQKFLPLLHGACVVLMADVELQEPSAFWDDVTRHGVNYLDTTPSLLAAMVDAAPSTLALHRAILGGEEMPAVAASSPARAAGPGPDCHTYGPTECCIDATSFVLHDVTDAARIPIGRPLANYRTYVLDDCLQPVPAGVAGELYIAGAGLARGYLGRAGLTAERFVADPFGRPAAACIARATWRAGAPTACSSSWRADAQVKLRGFRIEPGEIEAALVRHGDVAHAAVIAREGCRQQAAGGLCGGGAGALVDLVALRTHLAASLPDYMVPSAFVALDSFRSRPTASSIARRCRYRR